MWCENFTSDYLVHKDRNKSDRLMGAYHLVYITSCPSQEFYKIYLAINVRF